MEYISFLKISEIIRPNSKLINLFFFLFFSMMQLYKNDDPECSELCECSLGEVLSCSVLECIEKDACNTGVAFYSHASPFYQAYRGQCLCYSGSFVCSKPPKGKKQRKKTFFFFVKSISRNFLSNRFHGKSESTDFFMTLLYSVNLML